MASFNRVMLMGNLARAPELRTVGAKQTTVAEIGLAVNQKYGDREETVFVDVTLWGRTAEVAGEYLFRGSQVFIEGRLKFDTWEKNGEKRSKLRVVAERMQMLGGGRQGNNDGGDKYSEPAGAATPANNKPDDRIPF